MINLPAGASEPSPSSLRVKLEPLRVMFPAEVIVIPLSSPAIFGITNNMSPGSKSPFMLFTIPEALL